ncbi:MAG: 3'-5' exonuclease [Steroidobacteraceae bacterium]
MLHESLVILDFETTGLKPHEGDRITEVGLVRIAGGRVVDRYQSLANCAVRVPRFITAYTGITQQMVDDAPPIEQVMHEVTAFIGETPVVAHSASFDERFFARECQRLQMNSEIEPFLCSMRIARRIYPGLECHALGALAHSLKLPRCGVAHRAAIDAEVTAQLMLRMGRDLARMREGLTVTTQLLRDLMRMPVAQVQTGLEKLCA